MLNVKVLGPGCSNCYILEGLVIAAVQVLSDQKPQLFEDTEVICLTDKTTSWHS